MLYFLRPLPEKTGIVGEWKPFRQKDWLRKYFMYLVYLLQTILICLSIKIGIWEFFNVGITLALFAFTYVVHELIHIAVVYRAGDISLTYHGGVFLWLTPDAVLSKRRYWLYMICPFIVLTLIPSIFAIFSTGIVYRCLLFIACVNTIIAGADIFDSIFVLRTPARSIFWRGKYRIS